VANPLTAGASLTECIKIAAPNVQLFLAGNSITGSSASSTSLKFGIHILGTAPGAIVIGGDSTISQFSWGILVEGTFSAISGFSATGDGIGVVLRHEKGSQFTNFSASNNLGDGIFITNASHNFLNDFDASNNTQNGVEISSGSNFDELSGFTASSNGAAGVSVTRAINSSAAGPAHTIVFGGETDDNGTFGIAVSGSHGDTLVGNTAESNLTDDLFDGSALCTGNLWFGNTFTTANHSCIH
jgi:hypothetical protein